MPVRFAHKPFGSVLGSGSYVFRHYGKGKSTITFYIGGVAYQAEEGMTWYDFCNSDYNPNGLLSCREPQYFVQYNGDENIYKFISYDYLLKMGTEVIIAGANYNIAIEVYIYTGHSHFCYADEGMTWGQWIESPYNLIYLHVHKAAVNGETFYIGTLTIHGDTGVDYSYLVENNGEPGYRPAIRENDTIKSKIDYTFDDYYYD